MITSTSTILILMLTTIIITILLIYLLNKKDIKYQTTKIFTIMCLLMLSWLISIILQASFSKTLNIDPIYFDYLAYISICFLPVCFLLLSIAFENTKFKFNKRILLLLIVPTLSLLILWTNNIHHLFYITYSTNISDASYGSYFLIHTIYSYVLIGFGVINLIRYSIKNSGFFSRQSVILMLGVIIPVIINVLGTFGIIKMSIYITPISFALAILFFALAIFKFDFLKVAPIALQRVVDRISDAYLVVNEDNIVTDFNQTFLNLFNLHSSEVRNKNLKVLFNNLGIEIPSIIKAIKKSQSTQDTIFLEEHFHKINKYFNIEVNGITNKGNFLGTLILLKDITQHTQDMQTIKSNQDMLIEKERLATLRTNDWGYST